MLVTSKRPRDLKWFHAGPLLFGDWGTSRLYVIGLAFYFTAHATVYYLAAMSLVLIAVAWAYSVVCRCFPEGGGVYTAARQISPVLSVIGGTLLLCDYIVTAALSVVEGFHYMGFPHDLTVMLSCVTILGLGVINWLGAKSAGRFALLIAVAAIGLSAMIALLCVPYLGKGLAATSWEFQAQQSTWHQWESLVRIILALSGVEAVANMTGLMKEPVPRTAKKTIWPVLAEVVVLNIVFGIALTALPAITNVHEPWAHSYGDLPGGLPADPAQAEQVKLYRDTAMKELAITASQNAFGHHAGWYFGKITAVVFGLLLISAVNTAIMAKVSVMFSMAHDKELPGQLTKLNYSGVPMWGLVVACALPIGLLLVVGPDVPALAELYAIGVVGAIMISLLSCAVNKSLPLRKWERGGMWALGVFMMLVEATIIVAKPRAAVFAAFMIAAVLAARYFVHAGMKRGRRVEAGYDVSLMPEGGFLAELKREPLPIDPSKPRIMLAARGRYQAEFAVAEAKRRGAALFAIYVRTFRLMDTAPGVLPLVEDDKDAQEALGTIAVLARQNGVPFFPIYVCSPDIAEEILDYTVTFGCDTLILGKSRRKAIARAIEGDVVSKIAAHLPSNVALLARDASPDGTYTTEAVPHGPDEVPAPGREVASEHTSGATPPPGENGQRGQASPNRDKPAT
ncbi:MAG TPA: amino acid permease [Phycisphaerales bacterium]|nr:amino acid permease [Phycisphaerales bacterium]